MNLRFFTHVIPTAYSAYQTFRDVRSGVHILSNVTENITQETFMIHNEMKNLNKKLKEQNRLRKKESYLEKLKILKSKEDVLLKFKSLDDENWGQIKESYHKQKYRLFSPSAETCQAISNINSAANDEDRAAKIIEELFDERNSGRSFAKVLLEYVIDRLDLYRGNSGPLHLEDKENNKIQENTPRSLFKP